MVGVPTTRRVGTPQERIETRDLGRWRTPKPECREYALKVELGQPAGQVADPELRQKTLELRVGEVHAERSQQRLELNKRRDVSASSK